MRIETGFLDRRDCGGTGGNPEDQLHDAKGQDAGHRDGEYPCPNHVSSDAPLDCAEALGGADAHDGSRDDMGCGEGDSPMAGDLDDQG